MPRTKPTITLDEAQQVVAKAIARAQEMGIAIAVVVVDDAGGSVALSRMDGSPVMAVAMATGKAYTAVGMGAPTEVWENLSKDNPSFGGAITSIDGFVPFGGGQPLTSDGALIGAVGVSGGTVEQDVEIAKHAATALS